MASTFFGLNIARSGLFASQRALNVVSHNVANADTKGYSRQRLETTQYTPLALAGGEGQLGTGVETNTIHQIRNEFLDFKFRDENSIQGEWEFKKEMFSAIEAIFNEPSDSGIIKATNQFFSALQEFSKSPDNLTTRALVRQRAIALTEGMSRVFGQLKDAQKNIDFEIDTTVAQINGYAKEIATYNKLIHETEVDGGVANDIRDQRALVVDKLSSLVDVQAYEDTVKLRDGSFGKRFNVTVMGMPLVSHYQTNTLDTYKRRTKLHPDDAENVLELRWTHNNKKIASFNSNSGKVSALLDMRDGDKEVNKGIPYYIDKLNNYVNRVFGELNRIHMNGYGLKDALGNNSHGIMMFTMDGKDTANFETDLKNKGLTTIDAAGFSLTGAQEMSTLTADINTTLADFATASITADQRDDRIASLIRKEIAQQNNLLKAKFEKYNDDHPDQQKTFVPKTIMRFSDDKYYLVDQISCDRFKISADVDLDLNKFAAATDSDKTPGDNSNALDLVNMRSNQAMFAWGSPDDYVNSLVSNLGVDSEAATKVVKNQKILVNEVENRRQSVMGVSLDEEMSEMIKFQHSYSANARVLTAMDELLDVIVNRMGLVGR